MTYKTNREKAKDVIEKMIVPSLKQHDADYYKVVKVICAESNVSESLAQDVLNSFISIGKIIEERLLHLTDFEIKNLLEEETKTVKEAEAVLENAK